MKKRYTLAILALVVFVLAAFGYFATSLIDTQGESNLTLHQVFKKAIKRQQTLKNVHADVDMEQQTEMIVDGVIVQFSTSSDLAMEIQQKPMAMYTKGTVAMEMEGESMEMPMEMYMSESDGFYLLTGEENQWAKIPDNEYEQVLAQTGAKADATAQLKKLKRFINDFEFKQDDTSYLLTLNIEGDKLKEFIVGQLGSVIEGTVEMTSETVKAMSFEDSKYELVINKETFDTNEINMDITILMDIEDQQAQIKNDASIKYSKFDELDEITVPKEVKDNAVF
ncbi:hypothetical protein LZ480_12015 [Solibacillus sp. MA9]|uniref:DUF2092 domain-containing protein n=1 Tax=Solibacillus palustris TaxID=2908203 RepID=A0ABS9UE57_9BACL|nr:DUF6612 family protein [Solibacillus sp. MA9]MCH7322617.1 hypothetical protein [Solibacillus sp. MA9]